MQNGDLERKVSGKKKKSWIQIFLSLFYIFWIFWYSRFSFKNLKDTTSFMFLWCIATNSLFLVRYDLQPVYQHKYARQASSSFKQGAGKFQKNAKRGIFQLDKGEQRIFSCLTGGQRVLGPFLVGNCAPLCLLWYMIYLYIKYFLLTSTLQTHHVYSTFKRLGNDRFHVVLTWDTHGVFVGY